MSRMRPLKMFAVLLTAWVATCVQLNNADDTGLNSGMGSGSFPENASTTPATLTTIADSNGRCITDDGVMGICVPYYNCEQEPQEVGVLDLHFIENLCESYLDVCCAKVPSTVNPDSEKKKKGCGFRNVHGVGVNIKMSVNGKAEMGEFPWTVAILKFESTIDIKPKGQKQAYLGGGSLIHPNVVLTAAHILSSESKLMVRAGEWDSATVKEIYPHQEREVETIVIHEDYKKKTLKNDVSLLFLKSPMDLAPNVAVACLPSQQQRVVSGDRCTITGWEKDAFADPGRYSSIQNKVEVPVVDHDVCETQLRITRLGNAFNLHDTFMCAGGERDKDICIAAGGSPLSCPLKNNDQYLLNGMVAWTIGCNGVSPGAYVQVANFRSWIDKEVSKRGFDTSVYNVTTL